MSTTVFENMIGVRMLLIDGGKGDERMTLVAEDGRRFVFWYQHDCCASCVVEDICGDIEDLVGSPIVEAEEVSYYEPEPGQSPWELNPDQWKPDSFTWTFYRFSTAKGTVTVRWLGESNGYYSESVSYDEYPAS